MMKNVLTLNVKKIYFDQIASGEKQFEYREIKPYWTKRLKRNDFDEVHIKCGYPKANDTERCLVRPWQGYEIQTITHEHFGSESVDVYAILVNTLRSVNENHI